MERMKDQLGFNSLADLANDDECKLAERVMKQLNFVEMRRCFADSDWNAPDEEVLKKIQQRVEKHETSLEQLVKKKKKRVTTGYLYCVLTVQNAILENLSQKPIRKERKVQYTVYGEKPRMIRMWMLTIRYTPH